jgi:hypothetical protein
MDLAAIGLWPDETPSLQPSREKPESVLSSPKHLREIAAASAEDEDVTVQWILIERCLHLRRSLPSSYLLVDVSADMSR